MRAWRLVTAGCVTLAAACFLVSCDASGRAGTPTFPAPTPTATPNPNLGCTAVEAAPTAAPLDSLAPISEQDYITGPPEASVTMLFYCDLQSPQCEIFNTVLDNLMRAHSRDLRVVYRLFPVPAAVVPTLDKSEVSARAAIAAGNQNRFWEMRRLLHEKYGEWTALQPGEFERWVVSQAATLDLDPAKFAADFVSRETSAAAVGSYESAIRLGINGIPTVFINGQLQSRAALSASGLDSTIGLIALGSHQYRSCPPFEVDTSASYVAVLHTEKGDITIRLFPDRAPLTVNSFIFLARHGWFDGTTFHRVIPGYVAQAGDPSGTGSGGPGYYFKNEVYVDLLFDKPGVVGMANAGPDTNGSQFFITFAPEPQLDGQYTIFGQVIDGMEVVESLTPRDSQASTGLPPGDAILSVTIENR